MANVNKIHVNSSTKMSLNDRFTVISKIDPQYNIKNNSRQTCEGHTSGNLTNNSTIGKSSIANRILLQQLSRKHQTLAALKLKRRSLKPNMQNFRSRGPRRPAKPTLSLATADIVRSNSLANVATMQSNSINRTQRRSNFSMNQTLSPRITGRQLRRIGGINGVTSSRRQLLKNRGNASTIKQNLRQQVQRLSSIERNSILSRSNSRINAIRSRSRSRSNIRMQNSTYGRRPQSNNRDRSASRSRVGMSAMKTSGLSIVSRLGVNPNQRSVPRNQLRRQEGIRKAEGFIANRKSTVFNGESTGSVANRSMGRSRARGRAQVSNKINNFKNNYRAPTRGRSASRNRNQNRNFKSNRNESVNVKKRYSDRITNSQNQYRGRGRIGRVRGGRNKFHVDQSNIETKHKRGRSRARGRASRPTSRRRGSVNKSADVSKADLDKELDQYMANNEI